MKKDVPLQPDSWLTITCADVVVVVFIDVVVVVIDDVVVVVVIDGADVVVVVVFVVVVVTDGADVVVVVVIDVAVVIDVVVVVIDVVVVVVIDNAAAVNKLKPRTSTTAGQYRAKEFAAYGMSQLNNTQRLDFIWHVYKSGSLTEQTRQRSGKGVRLHVGLNSPLP